MDLSIEAVRARLNIPWRAKLKAFGAHLVLSAMLFAGIIVLVMALWYPAPFFWIDGGIQITLLAAMVDVFLGPLLTFVVYRPGRPKLAFNLAVIFIVQIAALSWGVHVLYRERPVLAAFVGWPQNRFFPVTQAQLADSARSVEELRGLSKEAPPYVYVDMPADPLEARKLQMSVLGGDEIGRAHV